MHTGAPSPELLGLPARLVLDLRRLWWSWVVPKGGKEEVAERFAAASTVPRTGQGFARPSEEKVEVIGSSSVL